MTQEDRYNLYAKILRSCVQDRGTHGWEYTLTDQVVIPLPEHIPFPGTAANGWFMLYDKPTPTLSLVRNYSTDGCTGAPDFSYGATLSRVLYTLQTEGEAAALKLCGPFIAHWTHDALFQFAKEVAAQAEVSTFSVINYANKVFNFHMEDCGTPRGQRLLYYAAVTIAGQPFAWYGRQKRRILKR